MNCITNYCKGPIPDNFHKCSSVTEYLALIEQIYSSGFEASPYAHIDGKDLWLGSKTKYETFVINLEIVRKHYNANCSLADSNPTEEFILANKWNKDITSAILRGKSKKSQTMQN